MSWRGNFNQKFVDDTSSAIISLDGQVTTLNQKVSNIGSVYINPAIAYGPTVIPVTGEYITYFQNLELPITPGNYLLELNTLGYTDFDAGRVPITVIFQFSTNTEATPGAYTKLAQVTCGGPLITPLPYANPTGIAGQPPNNTYIFPICTSTIITIPDNAYRFGGQLFIYMDDAATHNFGIPTTLSDGGNATQWMESIMVTRPLKFTRLNG